MARTPILGVGIDPIDSPTLVAHVEQWIAEKRAGQAARCRQVCTVNPEFVIDARRSPEFARVLDQADLCVADGIGILWAGRLLGAPFPQRVTGSDSIYTLCAAAAQSGQRVFFLGAGPGIAKKTAEILSSRYPGLKVAGVYGGSPHEDDWPTIARHLADAGPDLLFVAYGHPRQDYWIHRHRHELPAGVAMGVGGAFDFVAGVTRRAPTGWQRLGLEWLYRLLREPWRWRRMCKLPVFAWHVAATALHRCFIPRA